MTTLPSPPLACFPPVVCRDTRILILGSFPGEASLLAQEYYAHPRNQFWRLLSAVLDDELTALPYPKRLERLHVHRIGLWDVLAACEREGSLDTAIRRPKTNDFESLKRQCPDLYRVCFNGKTSGRFATEFAEAGFDTIALPSSSPAYAQMTFAEKLAVWRAIASGTGP